MVKTLGNETKRRTEQKSVFRSPDSKLTAASASGGSCIPQWTGVQQLYPREPIKWIQRMHTIKRMAFNKKRTMKPVGTVEGLTSAAANELMAVERAASISVDAKGEDGCVR